MTKFIKALVAIFLIGLGATSATSQTLEQVMPGSRQSGPVHAFASNAHPHSLRDVARAFSRDTDRVFRAPRARELFKAAIESQMGSMTDGQVAALLQSGHVQAVPCVGSIRTAGYDDIGRAPWFDRECEPGEQVLQVWVGGGWRTVASLYCLNPVSEPPVRINLQSGPCNQMHVLPEPARGQRTWVYVAQSDVAALEACNPGLRFCPDCQDFVEGRRQYQPVGDFAEFIAAQNDSGDRVVGLLVSGSPSVIWTNRGRVYYCREAWGRGSRVDIAEVRAH